MKYPYYTANEHMLINGNSVNVNMLPNDSVDLIVTSPPYNVGMDYKNSEDNIPYKNYMMFNYHWLVNCYVWAKKGGRLCVNVALDTNKDGKVPLSADITRVAMQTGWKYHTTIIWNEGNISKRTAWGSWLSASAPHVIAPVETILVFYKDEWRRGNVGESTIERDEFMEWTNGLWTFPGERKRKRMGHVAPFPRELPKRCIKLFSFEGDTVFDPFVGSGTTMIEAINNKRIAIGSDISGEYCDIARNRLYEEANSSFYLIGEDK